MHRRKPDLGTDADERENEAALHPQRVELSRVSHEVGEDEARAFPCAFRREAKRQDSNQQKHQPERDEKEVFPDRFERFFRAIEINHRREAESRQLQHYPEQSEMLRHDDQRVCQQVRVQRRIVEAPGGAILRLLHSLQEAWRVECNREKGMRENQQKEASQWIDPKPRACGKWILPREQEIKRRRQVPRRGYQRREMTLLQRATPRCKSGGK